VPEDDVRRRFTRGLHNFEVIYKPLAHRWSLYENSGATPVLIESGS
jgi:predicted ABC-type ATPase